MSDLAKSLWNFCNELRVYFHLKQSEYYKPALGALFLKYMDVNYQKTLKILEKEMPIIEGVRVSPKKYDFEKKGVIMLPEEAQFSKIISLPEDVTLAKIKNIDGEEMSSLGEVLDNAMKLIERESELFEGALFKEYKKIRDNTLRDLLKVFDREDVSDNSDKLGEVYEYFLGHFSLEEKGDEGVFFTPKSLVNMIVNILQPKGGKALDPFCGSGGMFVGIKKYMERETDSTCNQDFVFRGYELLPANVNICNMNLFMHNIQINSVIKQCNTFENDLLDLEGKCDYVLSNPPFCVKGVNIERAKRAGRIPFALPRGNNESFTNADYLCIQYFYSYLNDRGKAGFVMGKNSLASTGDKEIRKQIIETKHVDIIIGVADKFFQSGFTGEVCLWFFNKQKIEEQRDKILFIDASNYFSQVKDNPKQNTWSYWQSKNLIAVVWLYRGQVEKYQKLLEEYREALDKYAKEFNVQIPESGNYLDAFKGVGEKLIVEGEEELSKADKKDKNRMKEELDKKWERFEEALSVVKEYDWIRSKFKKGIYRDVPGLCKAADIKEVMEMDYCLGPRVYVGFEETEEDREDRPAYIKRMKDMHKELVELEKESQELTLQITENLSLWGE
ncbi:probable type I restriction-modification system DNA methylase, HsdM [Mycoplasma suis KI3806]|uniref:site-specific DNA-methyltransferase (adenine-specific) n=1 Tax=Mycoplasma suis (strain KI_3806) TaxID=708248 RepID=F0V399_MYCS3|nr:N-6 DNA methylase [Mycoplasma suis]CBZ40321.1 probable type I restriction-modification system DNA methylase, HsdM [Mycoplasma suis KI3806]